MTVKVKNNKLTSTQILQAIMLVIELYHWVLYSRALETLEQRQQWMPLHIKQQLQPLNTQ